VRGFLLDRFAAHCGEPIIMPEIGRENKAGSHSSARFGGAFYLTISEFV